jgi:hypothetical protein
VRSCGRCRIVGSSDRVRDPTEAHPGEEVGEVVGSFLDGDDFDDLDGAADLADHDAVLGMADCLDDHLAAVAEITVLQWCRSECALVECFNAVNTLRSTGASRSRMPWRSSVAASVNWTRVNGDEPGSVRWPGEFVTACRGRCRTRGRHLATRCALRCRRRLARGSALRSPGPRRCRAGGGTSRRA